MLTRTKLPNRKQNTWKGWFQWNSEIWRKTVKETRAFQLVRNSNNFVRKWVRGEREVASKGDMGSKHWRASAFQSVGLISRLRRLRHRCLSFFLLLAGPFRPGFPILSALLTCQNTAPSQSKAAALGHDLILRAQRSISAVCKLFPVHPPVENNVSTSAIHGHV